MSENNTEYWACEKCGTVNKGKFCTSCGAQKPSFETPSQEAINATYTETKEPVSPKKTKKSKSKKQRSLNPVFTAILAAVIGACAGFGGGMLASSNTTTETTIVREVTTETSSSTTTTASSTSSELTIQEIAAKAAPSVVEIVTETTTTSSGMFGGTYTTTEAGSGVIISSDGYIITNDHVVSGATSITVTLNDGTEYEATLVGTDSKSDIAVIKIEATDLTAATIGDSSTIQVGDTAVVIGNPLGTLGGTVTDGIISATDREVTINNETMNLIQTNAAINNGNSGGGLFDGNGNLIGIVNAKDSGITSSGATIEGLGFAIPINTAIDVAEQLITNGYVADRATIGVSLQTLESDYSAQYPAGLYITEVQSGSGAEAAGLKSGDRIIAADGTEISSYTELSSIMRDKVIGDTIVLTISRNGETMDVTVTLTGPLTSTD